MKKVGIIMTLLMGVTLSFCLSLTGNLTSEDGFKLIPFLVSFAVSTVISILIGFVVPMRKIESGAVKAMGLNERSLPANIISSLISDFIYTPVITLSMIVLARRMAMKMSNGHAQLPPFAIMFLKSLIISFVVAFLIILIVTPIYIKLSMKLAGVNPSAGGPPADKS
ncbi:hypothetical protein [Ruminococcus sp.]|uniref:hypothetical protein n=1 Tax=Ruminococcus sp. TaxID=41978 RepID=UPI0025E538CE|nr:hypothetical protein [Ruminococcus sp.]